MSRAMPPVKLHVTVTDLAAVQRVLALLTGRAHPLTRFEAEEAGGGRWRLGIDTAGTPADVELLQARLERLPSVLIVDVRRSLALAG